MFYSGGTVTVKNGPPIQITATFTWNGAPCNIPTWTEWPVIVTETVNSAWSGPGWQQLQRPLYLQRLLELHGRSRFCCR